MQIHAIPSPVAFSASPQPQPSHTVSFSGQLLSKYDSDARGLRSYDEVTLTVPLRVGALLRRKLREGLNDLKITKPGGLELDYAETKGLFDSNFIIRVEGKNAVVRVIVEELDRWATQLAT